VGDCRSGVRRSLGEEITNHGFSRRIYYANITRVWQVDPAPMCCNCVASRPAPSSRPLALRHDRHNDHVRLDHMDVRPA